MPDDMKAPFTAEEAAAELVRRYPTAFNGVDPLSQHGGLKLENARDWVLAAALLTERRKMVEALEEIYALADSFRPILEGICPPGYLPTRGMEEKASILARPFAVARDALTGSREHGA